MEELKAMFRVCAYTKKDGVRCNSPAMKGMNFCYQHIGGSIRELTRARSTYIGPKLDFVYPGSRQAIQHNFFVVAQAMNDGKIDLQTACAYNRIYSACERNLRRWEDLYQKNSPDKELAPLPDETPESEPSPTDVIPSEVEGPASSQPNENPGAPRLDSETWEKVPEQHENPGGPHKPVVGLSGEQTDSQLSPTDVIPSEATVGSEVEGPASPQPTENAGAPCLAETWEEKSPEEQNAGSPFKPGVGLSGEGTSENPDRLHPDRSDRPSAAVSS